MICYFIADLTPEEVAAIDAAGAQGPPGAGVLAFGSIVKRGGNVPVPAWWRVLAVVFLLAVWGYLVYASSAVVVGV